MFLEEFSFLFQLFVLLPGTFRKKGGMVEDHGAPETGQLPRAWP